MPSMDAIITGLGDIRAAMGRDESRQDDAEIIQAAVSMIYALSEEGAKTTDDALDILHDYRLQAKQYSALHYNDALRGWHRDEKDTLAQTSTKRREVLWMNFEPQRQTTIF